MTRREAEILALVASKELTAAQASKPGTAKILDRLVERKLLWSPCEPSGVTARYEIRSA